MYFSYHYLELSNVFLVHENVLFGIAEPDRSTIFDNQIKYRFVVYLQFPFYLTKRQASL